MSRGAWAWSDGRLTAAHDPGGCFAVLRGERTAHLDAARFEDVALRLEVARHHRGHVRAALGVVPGVQRPGRELPQRDDATGDLEGGDGMVGTVGSDVQRLEIELVAVPLDRVRNVVDAND